MHFQVHLRRLPGGFDGALRRSIVRGSFVLDLAPTGTATRSAFGLLISQSLLMTSLDMIPIPSPQVVVRREPKGAVLFQVHTDEMYSLSESAFTLFRLFDGARDLHQIAATIQSATTEADVGHIENRIAAFAERLADRQLIELW